MTKIMFPFFKNIDVSPDITFFLARLGAGGIGKMRIHLINELMKRGIKVELVLGDTSGPYLEYLGSNLSVYKLGSSHGLTAVFPFTIYLLFRAPRVVICEKLRVNVVAHRAKKMVRSKCQIFASIHGVLSHKLENEGLPYKKKKRKYELIRKWYPKNEGFIAVSRGIADDLNEHFGVPKEKIYVIHNPVLTPEVIEKGKESPNHPWFNPKTSPIILSVGRLEDQKGYPTLIYSFNKVRRIIDCRLIILGEGSKRSELKTLINKLGIQDYVSMPGFIQNPYPFMRLSDVFVLSSRWEGFGNVLVEAMAFGTPVVSTDCPAGPKEILEGGKLGHLVPVDDPDSMAEAIVKTIKSPPPPGPLILASQKYTAENCAQNYLKALGIEAPH